MVLPGTNPTGTSRICLCCHLSPKRIVGEKHIVRDPRVEWALGRGSWWGGAEIYPPASPITHSQPGKGLCRNSGHPHHSAHSGLRGAVAGWRPVLPGHHLCPSAQVSHLLPSLDPSLSSHLLKSSPPKTYSLVIYSRFPLATPNNSFRQKYLFQGMGGRSKPSFPCVPPTPAPGSWPEGSK